MTMRLDPATPASSRFVVRGTNLVDLARPEQPVFFRGIGYSPFLPGETPVRGMNPGNDQRYPRHLQLITDMHANFIHVFPRLMPENFFRALDQTNLAYG